MFLIKEGMPDEDELVMCTVTKVQFHSVFVTLDEYKKSGMIHISEVSPGRIRNIRDFVKEGKKVVCKVLRIHRDKGHIDLSLRRVTEAQRRNKVNELKAQQKAEKIVEYVAKDQKLDTKKLFLDILKNVGDEHGNVYNYFQAIVEGTATIKDMKQDAKVTKALEEIVRQRISEKSVKIEGTLSLSSYAVNGVDVIKEALEKAQKVDEKNIELKYLGSGSYGLSVVAKDYKKAEKMLKDANDAAISHVEKHEGSGSFERLEA